MWNVPANANSAPINYYATPANYYNAPLAPQSTTKRKVGLVLGGGLLGMLYYHRPVRQNEFIKFGFEQTVLDVQTQMAALKKARRELNSFGLSTDSKSMLNSLGVAENTDIINLKIKDLHKSINDPTEVSKIKQGLVSRFKNIKKDPALRTNVEKKTFELIRQSHLRWGVGIGAAVALVASLLLL